MKSITNPVWMGLFMACSMSAMAPAEGKETHAPAPGTKDPSPESSSARVGSKAPASLLWVRCKYNGPQKERLVQSEKMTVEEYRRRGVDVVEFKSADFDAWRKDQGKDYAHATKRIQQVAFARSLQADAVGGLDVLETEEEFEGKPAGAYFYGWGIALKACTSNFTVNFEGGDQVRAIPLALVQESPWDIPRAIDPTSCSSQGDMESEVMMTRGRPFLGVMLEGRRISRVVAGSPAQEAGVAPGDLLLSVAGREVNGIGDLAELMAEKKPGDEIEYECEREGVRSKKKVKLADRAEVEAKNAPDGKPLPGLVAKDIEGHEVRLADLKGKVVMLDFWATWCGPCVEEMPLMQLAWENLKDKGLVWVGVSADDDDSAWRTFVKDNRVGGIQLRDEAWLTAMSVGGYPTIFLVDRDAVVRCRVRGGTIAQAAAALLQE